LGDRTALERLAERHGVALDYRDIWGNRHHAAPGTLVAILAAMGVPATDDAAAEAALRAEHATRWRRLLPPVMVVRADRLPSRVRLNLPIALDGATFAWRIREELGAEHGGELVPAALRLLESATLNGETYAARELPLPVTPPLGYHRLEIVRDGETLAVMPLVVVPRACYSPPALAGGARVWGLAVQLYAVRSERNWGIGDLTDLRALVELWGARGAAMIGVNPLHALFPHNPAHASPYSPSSRLFVNVLYLDVEAVDDYRECEDVRAHVRSATYQMRLKTLRDAELVDYPGVAAAKFEVLERLYAHFRRRHLAQGTLRAREFRAFQARGGNDLRRHALFEALQAHLHSADPSVWGWQVWPAAYRDPEAEEVARFAAERLDRVEFYEYLQWHADRQLAAVGRRSFELGFVVGLYQDLALSVDRAGGEVWSNQRLYAAGAGVGAPPDDFNLNGQDWGLPPLVPERLRAAAFTPFVATLRANMRHAGALRIDHVMGLMRLFWVPPAGEPKDGAYVHYPFADLLGLVALESQRNRCLVIGEDLGTVPDEVRAALAEAGVLSYRVLYFERDGAGDFKPPADYPVRAIVAAGTHDLPTLAGWWSGDDLALRESLGMFPTPAAREAQIVGRAQDRARLLLALERQALLPPGASINPVSLPAMTPELARALHLYLARAPAQLLAVQIEDVLGIKTQVNLPGSTDAHPNWRRKLPLALERFPDDEHIAELAAALARLRGRPRRQRPKRDGAEVATIPRATYRLQLHRDFTFAHATELVPYLARLGVSHVYCSPYLRARPGSRHGYDIIDHAALNPEIGNRDDFDRFVAELKAHGMGQILDMVPNHMGVMGADNVWWMGVLEDGPASAYAGFFDIEWEPVDPAYAGKVVVPVLGDHYGEVLERGELKPAYEPESGSFAVWYHEHRFPVDPREYPRVLERAVRLLAPDAVPRDAAADLESLIAALAKLPPRSATAPNAVAERARDKALLKARLARLVREHPAAAEAIDRAVRALAGSPGMPASFAALHELLEAQAYRLAYWRVAADEINYRRFFDINDLAALRMENEAVFEATHRFVLDLAAEGAIDGLRIDHPDGLYDPARYFRRLQERYAQLASIESGGGERPRPLYVVVEKIIAPHEQLPESWPVHGTTGYRFANVANGLFVNTDARERVDRTWRAFVRDEALDFDEAAYRGKRAIMRSALAGELNVLANRLLRLARATRRTRDYTLNTLRQALADVVACFPVYRTYIAERLTAQDRRYVDWAVAQAKRRGRAADGTVFDFVRSALLSRAPAGAPDDLAAEYRTFAMRFQQFSAPVTGKGVEDTAFYSFNRLVALNEVGGHPDDFGMTVSAFHGASADRAAKWPHTMLATSTHDSKRSEDVRARIDVISELPAVWRLAVRRWSRINRSKKRTVEGEAAPSRNDEYLLYQTLIGSFPAEPPDADGLTDYRDRIESYMVKAAREAKVRTSWINPNEAYERAVAGFVQALLGKTEGNLFLEDFRAQLAPFAWYGALNSLSMVLVKLTSPGVPDLYQGNELADLSLVDPDSRRPVDYALRRMLLAELEALAAAPPEALGARVHALCARPHDGRAKLWTTWRTLALRHERSELFARGDYHAIAVAGARAPHAIAYARRLGSGGIIVVAGRLFASLGLDAGVLPLGAGTWGDTTVDLSFLPAGTRIMNWLTGETVDCRDGRLPLARALARFPGALLAYDREREAAADPQ
jgi:(1->4)-alpha-D-glucan 1-alpha-D-glucosylmutase